MSLRHRWRGPLAILLLAVLLLALLAGTTGPLAAALPLAALWWIAFALVAAGRAAAAADPHLLAAPFLSVARGRAPPDARF